MRQTTYPGLRPGHKRVHLLLVDSRVCVSISSMETETLYELFPDGGYKEVPTASSSNPRGLKIPVGCRHVRRAGDNWFAKEMLNGVCYSNPESLCLGTEDRVYVGCSWFRNESVQHSYLVVSPAGKWQTLGDRVRNVGSSWSKDLVTFGLPGETCAVIKSPALGVLAFNPRGRIQKIGPRGFEYLGYFGYFALPVPDLVGYTTGFHLDEVAVSSDGTRLAVRWRADSCYGSRLGIYSMPDRTEQRVMKIDLRSAVFSPDGLTLWGWTLNREDLEIVTVDLDI